MRINERPIQRSPTKALSPLLNPPTRKKLIVGLLLVFMLSACANYGTPKNIEIPDPRVAERYSLHDWSEAHSDSDIRFILTFSGGGYQGCRLILRCYAGIA